MSTLILFPSPLRARFISSVKSGKTGYVGFDGKNANSSVPVSTPGLATRAQISAVAF